MDADFDTDIEIEPPREEEEHEESPNPSKQAGIAMGNVQQAVCRTMMEKPVPCLMTIAEAAIPTHISMDSQVGYEHFIGPQSE
jgi:hypothetical protein